MMMGDLFNIISRISTDQSIEINMQTFANDIKSFGATQHKLEYATAIIFEAAIEKKIVEPRIEIRTVKEVLGYSMKYFRVMLAKKIF